MMDAVQKAQHELTSSSRALSQMMAALALAEATDTKQQKLALQIQSLTGELKELQTRWQILLRLGVWWFPFRLASAI
jgi:redox-regulated HSP33 family molecular chaperone